MYVHAYVRKFVFVINTGGPEKMGIIYLFLG